MDIEGNGNRGTRKRSRAGNAEKLGHIDEGKEDREEGTKGNQIVPWQLQYPSSRIYRVCRATGGKDRHSKVLTTKGLRDRRIRLSVSTAIQFYDLQDRLGFDQPSKAIEWLLKAAANAINELPALNGFPEFGDVDGQVVADIDQNNLSLQHCSSTSETSKGSILSLSRSETRGKGTEKAQEQDVKEEREREESSHTVASHISNLCSPTSFTELLTGATGGSNGAAVTTNAATVANSSPSSSIQRQISTAEYFTNAGLFTQANHQVSSGFASLQHSPFVNSSAATAMAMVPFNIAAASEMQQQQFSFMQDSMSDYNLNFTMSSSLAGFNRGTLQSNSQSQLHNNIQRLSSVGSSLPFFFSPEATASPATGPANAENQFLTGFDSRLQLFMKGKGKG